MSRPRISRRLAIAVFVLLPAGCLWLLITSPALVEASLPGGLPVGNVLTAMALAAWPTAAALLARPRSRTRRFAGAGLAFALAWLPLSAMLAGNLALNFAGRRGSVWLGFTVFVMSLGLATLLASMAQRLRRGSHQGDGR